MYLHFKEYKQNTSVPNSFPFVILLVFGEKGKKNNNLQL